LNNLIATFLDKHPDKKNTEEYYKDMEEKAKLLWNGGNNANKQPPKKQEKPVH